MQVEQIVQLFDWGAIFYGFLAVSFLLCTVITKILTRPAPAPEVPHSETTHQEPQLRNRRKRKEKKRKTIEQEAPVSPQPEPEPPKRRRRVLVTYVPDNLRSQLDKLTELPGAEPQLWIDSADAFPRKGGRT